MVYRRPLVFFSHRAARRPSAKYILNELPKTYSDKVYPQIPYMIRKKEANIKVNEAIGNNPSGQLYGLAMRVTKLIRDERVVCSSFNVATTIRPHVDRLIVEAMRNGDKHRPTMALANFWLLDKSLIHKLFKELVPRYENYSSAFTAIHRLGYDYTISSKTMTTIKERRRQPPHFNNGGETILELRGNNLPPILRPQLYRSGLLSNVLINAARKDARLSTWIHEVNYKVSLLKPEAH